MKNQFQDSDAADTPQRPAKSASNIDIRSAVALAKVALQTLADLHPEAASAIDHGLAAEIKAAELHPDPDSVAVVAILSDVRARLAGDDVHILGDENAWYID